MRVRFTDRSIVHLALIRDYLAQESPQVAELVRLRILATIERLHTFPGIGHPGRRSGTREVRVAGLPYLIVYRSDDVVVILGVFHTAQDR